MVYNIKGANPAEVDIDIKAGNNIRYILFTSLYIKKLNKK